MSLLVINSRTFIKKIRSLIFIGPLFFSLPVFSGEVRSIEEVIKLSTQGCQIKKHTYFLPKDVKKTLNAHSSIVLYYTTTCPSKIKNKTIYLDTHPVRTKPESLLIHISDKSEVDQIEVIAFSEPIEYKAPEKWYKLFQKKSNQIKINNEIPNITGATFTSNATKEAVNRVLSIHQIISKDK